ncbi:unnamed protein product [Rotaria sp. Silwood1]|nr:unnamed protein product [Rotaria sp. Silwood1]CAF1598867.1 unnamed protein product [Rotaria sp. Silwood1]
MPPEKIIDSKDEDNYYGDNNNNNKIFTRQIDNRKEDTIQHIKALGITYRQIIKDGQCAINYDGQIFIEGDLMKIRKKQFRIENCLLERVYHACGPKLLLMLSVVCRVVEHNKVSDEILNLKRETNFEFIHHRDSIIDREKRVIAESCCENHCTVSELTRYCH